MTGYSPDQAQKMAVDISVVGGVEGDALVVGGLRVAGPKPWGGGRVVKVWAGVSAVDIIEALFFSGKPRNPTKAQKILDAAMREAETES